MTSFEDRLEDAMAIIQKIPTDYDAMNKHKVKYCGNAYGLPAEQIYDEKDEDGIDTYYLLNFVQGMRGAIQHALPEVTEQGVQDYIDNKQEEMENIDHSGRGSSCCQKQYCLRKKIEGAKWILQKNEY